MIARGEAPVDGPLGNIITFYSYKGGTGRSMAVANVAWILASNGKRVLTVDWDLEAPGLHRYYSPFLGDKDLTGSEGLIDLLIEFRDATAIAGPGESDDDWHKSYADIAAYVVSLDWDFPGGGTLDLLPAGRQGASYSARVNSFDWVEFYERRGGGVFLEAMKEKMRADYDYVLIDSRTGVSDTSGICTVQMPDAVVVCFTLNNQGIKGSAAVSHSIYEQRVRKGRDIAIFPVPMRVEPFEKIKLDTRREYAKKMFEVFPAHLPPQSRAQFQEDTQVKYLPYYAYEEILATFGNRPGESESTSLLAPAERLTAYLTDYLPGEQIGRLEASEYLESRRQSVLALFEGKQGAADPTRLLILSADAAWAGLKLEDERIARRALLRLARVADAGEQGGDTRLRVTLSEFDEATQNVLRNLDSTPLVTIERDSVSGEASVQLSSDDLLRNWPSLQSWIQEDREFLLWRQKLDIAIAEWKRLNEDDGALLGGAPLELAKRWQSGRPEDFNENETDYINRSVAEEERRRREHIEREAERTELQQQTEVLIKTSQQSKRRSRLGAAISALVILPALAVGGWWGYRLLISLRRAPAVAVKAAEDADKKNFDEAIKKYNEAISLDPSYPIAYYGRGSAYLEIGRFDDALSDFNEAIRLDPNYTVAYIGRGDVYWQKRDLANALADYNRAIDLDPKISDAYTKRGKVLAEQGQVDKAVIDYNHAIDLSPNDSNAYLWRGSARSKSGDYDRALKDFNSALDVNPKLAEAHIKRAEAFQLRSRFGDNEQAITEYTKAINQTPYDPKLYILRAEAYLKSRKREQAIADYEKARDLTEGDQKNAEVNQTAKLELQKLNPKLVIASAPADQANPKIYLGFHDKDDIKMLGIIAAALRKQPNYTVGNGFTPAPDPTESDVVYYHKEDEANARKIKEIVEDTLRAARVEQPLELKLSTKPGASKRAPQGWIEVWLPPLPKPAFRPVRRNSPAQYETGDQKQPDKAAGKSPISKN
ncbi:MAG: tetratricopeptide repeat protein [Blastocatellia bacterium]|nr:tetratricopeptide repeat protein [Blastocatellia bacterium]